MEKEAREAWNRYQREYRKRNPDKVRGWRENYLRKLAAKQASEGGGGDGRRR